MIELYEWKVIQVLGDGEALTADEIADRLNALEEEGFEVRHIVHEDDGTIMAYGRRPRQVAPA